MVNTYFENIRDKPQELANKYLELKAEYSKVEFNIQELNKLEALEEINKMQIFYEKFSDLGYFLSPAITTVLTVKNRRKEDVPVSIFEDASKYTAERIQFKYLFPLTLKLSEFAENKAKKRDLKYFILAVAVSSLLGMLTSWLPTHLYDTENDEISKETEKKIISEIENQKILQKKITVLEHNLSEKKIMNDSLIIKLKKLTKSNK